MHITHVEDYVLELGIEGAQTSISVLSHVKDMLNGDPQDTIKISTKWDGSPALVVGINPENTKFFIGTKSVFAKTKPILCYSESDIKEYYSHNLELCSVLLSAFKYLKPLNISGIYQGDVMFANNDKRIRTISGVKHITFQPNTILYAVPLNSIEGQEIHRAEFGIVFHTSFTGSSMKELERSTSVDLQNTQQNVWIQTSRYKNAVSETLLTNEEIAFVDNYLQNAMQHLNQIEEKDIEKLLSNKNHLQFIHQHHNHLIKQGSYIDDVSEWIQNLYNFLIQKVNKQKVSDGTKEKKINLLHEHTSELETALKEILKVQRCIFHVKQMLIEKLSLLSSISTFHITNEQINPTKPEGFVIATDTGDVLKLVDRLEFSKQNFLRRNK